MVDVRLDSKYVSVIGAFLIPLHLNNVKIHCFVTCPYSVISPTCISFVFVFVFSPLFPKIPRSIEIKGKIGLNRLSKCFQCFLLKTM